MSNIKWFALSACVGVVIGWCGNSALLESGTTERAIGFFTGAPIWGFFGVAILLLVQTAAGWEPKAPPAPKMRIPPLAPGDALADRIERDPTTRFKR